MVAGDDLDDDERARRLSAEPAQRILEAARRMVGDRGIEQSTMRDIAQAAGVALGLVTYYFGTKDRLLAEVMEADARDRIQLLREELTAAQSVDELVEAMATNLRDFMRQDRGAHLVLQELGSLALRDDAIQARRAQLRARYRRALANLLRDKRQAGIIDVPDEQLDSIAAVLIALGQGIATEVIADPDWDCVPALQRARAIARELLLGNGPARR